MAQYDTQLQGAEEQALIRAALGGQEQRPKGIGGFIGKWAEGYLQSDRIAQDPHYMANKELLRQRIEANRADALNKIYERGLAIQARQGMAEINAVMAKHIAEGGDPDKLLSELYTIGQRYPFPPDVFDRFVEQATAMKERKQKLEDARREHLDKLELQRLNAEAMLNRTMAEQDAIAKRAEETAANRTKLAEAANEAKLKIAAERVREANARWAGHKNLAHYKARMALLGKEAIYMDPAQVSEAADRIYSESFGSEEGAPSSAPSGPPGDTLKLWQ